MDTAALATWLSEQKWELAAGVAEDLLTRELPLSDRAFAHYVACKSYSNLGRFTQSLPHAHAAVADGIAVQSFDLVGKSLLELAFIQQQLGRHDEALVSLDSFRRYLPHYADDGVKSGVVAQINRGVALRSVGEYEQALGDFLQGMEKAHSAGDVKTREYCRTQATWVALELGNVPLADDLVTQGELHLKRFPEDRQARAWHLNDKASLARLRNQPELSATLALEAACAAGDDAYLLAYSFWSLHLAGMAMREVEPAFKVGLIAKELAEVAENPILVERISDALSQVVLQHRPAVERIGRQLLETKGMEA